MLRVWGGGLFEKDVFYDECDRLGILVIQDLLMACGEYPEDQGWFLDRLRREAACAAKRLRSHPSLAWWNGDNENAARCDLDMTEYPGPPHRHGNRRAGPAGDGSLPSVHPH